MNTKGMTFFRMDWANEEATALVCTTCSHIAWFMKKPSRIEE